MPKEPLQVNQPKLPAFERLVCYGKAIDAVRYYTNFGAMHELLRQRLAGLFEMDEGSVGLASSGTTALSALLQATAGRAKLEKPLCVCPAFTFVATAAAAVEVGYTPYLVDIDPETWALDPATVETLPLFRQVGAVIVTAPMGRMVDLHAWQAFSDRTRVPVIVDAAAGFDTLDFAALRAVRLPVMISLHATKTFSTCEGGLMLCADHEIIDRASAAISFGFEGKRLSLSHGVNGKMSEYHAIIGLVELEDWQVKRDGFRQAGAHYLSHARNMGLEDQVFADGDHALPYAHFLTASPEQAVRVTLALDAALIGWVRWYGMGLRSHPAFQKCPTVPLPHTEYLAHRLIGLPMMVDLRPADIWHTLETIRRAYCDDWDDSPPNAPIHPDIVFIK